MAKLPPIFGRKVGKRRSGWQVSSRASRHARGYGTAWDKTRAEILRRDRFLCQSCKRSGKATAATEVDHVIPKWKGGKDVEGNLEAICSACHKAKTAAEAAEASAASRR